MDQFNLVKGSDLRPLSSLVKELAPQLHSSCIGFFSHAVTEELINSELGKKNHQHQQQPNAVTFQQLVIPNSIPSVHIRQSTAQYSARSSIASYQADPGEEQTPVVTPVGNRDSLYYSSQSVLYTSTNVSPNDGAKEERCSRELNPILEVEQSTPAVVNSIEEEAEELSDEQEEHRKSCLVL